MTYYDFLFRRSPPGTACDVLTGTVGGGSTQSMYNYYLGKLPAQRAELRTPYGGQADVYLQTNVQITQTNKPTHFQLLRETEGRPGGLVYSYCGLGPTCTFQQHKSETLS